MPKFTKKQCQSLSNLFLRGSVYADRWPEEDRSLLDIPDADLLTTIRAALDAGKIVVISGNAGDGKSHLAMRAIDDYESGHVWYAEDMPDDQVEQMNAGDVLFIRDVSAMTNDEAEKALRIGRSKNCSILMTINEGPLDSLARSYPDSPFSHMREYLRAHSRGIEQEVSDQLILINLAGRQLARSDFVDQAIEKVADIAAQIADSTLEGSAVRDGARMLRKSARARKRLQILLELVSNQGTHLTARQLWAFLIDMFFRVGQEEVNESEKYHSALWWNRVFDGASEISKQIVADFDPVHVALSEADGELWLGRFETLNTEDHFPGGNPSSIARDSAGDALSLFRSAKRFYFFFSKDDSLDEVMTRHLPSHEYGKLLETAFDDPDAVISDFIGLVNKYRMGSGVKSELLISRHHGYAAQRRPTTLAACTKAQVKDLKIRVPYSTDSRAFPRSGFFPRSLIVYWLHNDHEFEFDFSTWRVISGQRTLTADRRQEMVDFALDIFLSKAPVSMPRDPEIHVFDHRTRKPVQLRLRISGEQKEIELL